MSQKRKNDNTSNDLNHNDSGEVVKKAELKSENDIDTLKKIVYRIWGFTEALRSDVEFIKNIYTSPKGKNKIGANKTERIAKLKHRLITSGKRTTDSNNK